MPLALNYMWKVLLLCIPEKVIVIVYEMTKLSLIVFTTCLWLKEFLINLLEMKSFFDPTSYVIFQH